MSTLDQWEAEAKRILNEPGHPDSIRCPQKCIIALINLIREKDKALRMYASANPFELGKDNSIILVTGPAKEALKLTEVLI